MLFFVEEDFFFEDDFLVEVVLCVELECLVLVLVTALFLSSMLTLQAPVCGLHPTAGSIPVVLTGDTLPATAETSSRAKAEIVETLRILNESWKERKKD